MVQRTDKIALEASISLQYYIFNITFFMTQGNFLYSESLMLTFPCRLPRSLFVVQCECEYLIVGQEISVECQQSGIHAQPFLPVHVILEQ